jgi:hypothetical protein
MTRRQRQILTLMRDNRDNDTGELVYDGGRTAYLNLERISPRTLWSLIRLAAISADQFNTVKFQRYTINENGLKLLADEVPAEAIE